MINVSLHSFTITHLLFSPSGAGIKVNSFKMSGEGADGIDLYADVDDFGQVNSSIFT